MQSQNNIVAIYGDTLYQLDETHTKIPKLRSNPKYRMPFCHQSAFVKTSLLKAYKFDTDFKICADNEFFTKVYNAGGEFLQCDMIVSVYDSNGVSSTPSLRFCKEELKIGQRYNKAYFLYFLPKYLWNVCKYGVRALLPRNLANALRSVYNAK
ncbi:hypothetical protein [uncultured Helicobacter sp.]|uniref:hypothetical protein n=1 Tax=uncultured Helicobacter sp. TaxID=175537 RepID=UPI001C3B8AF9|nr:hypothetical protein [Candidatus Helicobacter avicola]